MPRSELADKAAFVTGAARGIGLATAQALIARGASVAMVDLDLAAAERAATQAHAARATSYSSPRSMRSLNGAGTVPYAMSKAAVEVLAAVLVGWLLARELRAPIAPNAEGWR